MQQQKALKTTNRPITRKTIWGFDTEDNNPDLKKVTPKERGKQATVLQIAFTDGTTTYRFTDRDKAINFLLLLGDVHGRKPIYVCATNLDYDLQNLLGHRFDLLELTLKNGGGQMVSAKLRGTKVIFYDTLNHAPFSVKQLGEYIGLPKLDFNVKGWEYVDRDAEISQKFMVEFQKRYNMLGGQMNATLPSSALDLYRRKHLPFPIHQPPQHILDFLWCGYYGGRTEVFNVAPQKGNIHYTDVVSLYPYVMRECLFPNPNIWFRTKQPNLDGYGMADVNVFVPNLKFPPLPYRGEKLIFPVGNFRGVYTYPHLRALIHRGGRVLKVYNAIEFPDYCRPFQSYVDTLYPIKEKALDTITRTTAKLLLNSLYGKFAERIEDLLLVPINDVPPDKTAIVYGDVAVIKGDISSPNHSNVIWSAYTTTYAQLHLLKMLELVHNSGGVPLYCDTDSVIYKGKRIHGKGKNLGDWGHEGTFKLAHFLAPKLYRIDERFRAKGVPRAHAKDFFETGSVEFERPFRWRGAFKRGYQSARWGLFSKEIKSRYDKRIILDNGDTAPLQL